jgi:pilus assembly protein CpaC
MNLPNNKTLTHSNDATWLVCVALLLIVVLPESSRAQMLAQRSELFDKERVKSPAAEVVGKEQALIHEVLEPELILRVNPSRSKIVRTKLPIGRIAIGNPAIVDVTEFSPTEIEIIGKSLGETTMTLWFPVPGGGTAVLRYLVEVAEKQSANEYNGENVAELQNKINELFPNSQVQLVALRNKMIVKGQARDAEEAQNILSLLGRSVGTGRNNAYNNGQSGYGTNSRGNNFQNNGNATFAGSINNQRGGGGTQLVNLLRVPGVQQVMLKVRVAELSRNSARELGADLRGVIGSLALGHVLEGLDEFTAILDGSDVRLFLRAFASHGYGKILAEPTLVTVSGKTARFLSGGEFAVPTTVGIGGVGAASTSFRGFGTEVEFTPTVLDKDLIRLQVAPSFSSLNGDATVNGIPGLTRRSVETTVDLREGQWLAIAGLIQDEQGGSRSKLPYVGSLPMLGSLFGNQSTQRNETELIILVSPELVHPMESEEVPLQLPGMEVTDPTNEDFFRRHLTEGYTGNDYRSTVWPEIDAQQRGSEVSHIAPIKNRIRCQKDYISGPCGFSE